MPRCLCVSCGVGYDRRYVRRVDAGWPRWLAYIACPPRARDVEAARVSIARYENAEAEGRIGVGILGSVICPDRETAQEITRTFGLRR